MGVDILFFSNHKIKGNSFKERKNEFEQKLQAKIQLIPNIPYQKENLPRETDRLEEVIYFITNPKEEERFNSMKEISIKTNFAYLSEVRIFNKTMMFYPNKLSTDSYRWKLYLGDKYEKKKNSTEYLEYNRVWKRFQKLKYQLIHKLGGNKIVYIDDQSFQEPEDLFYQGKELEKIITELKKVGPLFKLEKLYNDFDKIFDDSSLTYYGFYEKLE